MTPYTVLVVQPSQVDGVWASVAPMLEKATMRQQTRVDELLPDLRAQRKVLIVVMDEREFCAATVLDYLEHMDTLCVYAIAGEGLAGWAGVLNDALTSYGKELGAKRLRGYTREGFVKVLAPLGWTRACTVIEREL